MRSLVVLAALASAAHADSLAVGIEAGKCVNCASGDRMGMLGAALEVDHIVAEHLVAHGELAHDWIRIASDECEYQFTGDRTRAGAGVRWQERRNAGVFLGLALDASYATVRDRCAGSQDHAQLHPALVPALGYDAVLGARSGVRLEAALILQDLVTYERHQTIELVAGASYVIVL